MRQLLWGRLAGAGALAAAALLSGAGSAQADPPPGWEPGQWGVEYDYGDIVWTHHGWYDDARGNWHTGWLNVEEDDDGITGVLIDWRCPAGVTPPTYIDQDQTTACMQKGLVWLSFVDYYDSTQFDQARNRFEIHLDVPAYDYDGNPVGEVRLDVVIQGRGDPVVTSNESGPILDYDEAFYDLNSWGKVNGHRIKGPNTVQADTHMGFYLDGWVRA